MFDNLKLTISKIRTPTFFSYLLNFNVYFGTHKWIKKRLESLSLE